MINKKRLIYIMFVFIVIVIAAILFSINKRLNDHEIMELDFNTDKKIQRGWSIEF